MKRIVSAVLTAALVFSMGVVSFAAQYSPNTQAKVEVTVAQTEVQGNIVERSTNRVLEAVSGKAVVSTEQTEEVAALTDEVLSQQNEEEKSSMIATTSMTLERTSLASTAVRLESTVLQGALKDTEAADISVTIYVKNADGTLAAIEVSSSEYTVDANGNVILKLSRNLQRRIGAGNEFAVKVSKKAVVG